jgi:two-component system, response regulator PdtaR
MFVKPLFISEKFIPVPEPRAVMQTKNVKDITLVHFAGKRVLVCEDNHLIAAGWAMILADAGYQVVGPVSCAEKALQAAYCHPPDLALVDIALNGTIDGISVAAELAPLGIPIVFVTADYQRAAEEGRAFAADILIKPVRLSTL